MRLYETPQTLNPTYNLDRSMKPIGILVHSTGATNTTLKRYVDAPELLGRNLYGNHWNKPTANKSMHAFIGHDINGDVAICHTLPYDKPCWGCGAGVNGSYNRDPVGHIQFEVCEDNAPRSGKPPTAANIAYYKEAWQTVEDYCVYLCKMFGWTGKNITSHYEAAAAGYASNHGDPRHWMKLFGDSMDKFRARVDARLVADAEPPVVVEEETVTDESTTSSDIIHVQLTREENYNAYKVAKNTIVKIPFEDYLESVVASEVGNAPLEAAKAQAIAARSYALPFVLKSTPITDTTTHQAFRMSRYHNPAYAAAYEGVRRTEGLVLGYAGKLTHMAYYCHSNGGRITASNERWSGPAVPFLLAKDDPWTAASKEPKNGHGVGMSQVGAIYAAKELGKTSNEILAFYYPGTEVVNWHNPVFAPPPVIPAEPVTKPVETVLYQAQVNTRYPAGLSLWTSPAKRSKAHKGLIAKGSIVEVISAPANGWVRARYQGDEGYIDNQYLVKTGTITAEPPKQELALRKVKTRFGRGIGIWTDTKKSRRLIQIPDGTEVQVIGDMSNNWKKVSYNGIVGYADGQYLTNWEV